MKDIKGTDCFAVNDDKDFELELLKSATGKVVKYLNFINDGGHTHYVKQIEYIKTKESENRERQKEERQKLKRQKEIIKRQKKGNEENAKRQKENAEKQRVHNLKKNDGEKEHGRAKSVRDGKEVHTRGTNDIGENSAVRSGRGSRYKEVGLRKSAERRGSFKPMQGKMSFFKQDEGKLMRSRKPTFKEGSNSSKQKCGAKPIKNENHPLQQDFGPSRRNGSSKAFKRKPSFRVEKGSFSRKASGHSKDNKARPRRK